MQLRRAIDVLSERLGSIEVIVSQIEGTFSEFDTVVDMLQSETTWSNAKCLNWETGDEIITVWLRLADGTTVLPNGYDTMQAIDGAILLKTFAREAPDGTTVPSLLGTPYTVSHPLAFRDIADVRAATFSAPSFILENDDASDAAVFWQGGVGADDGINEVINAAGIHYTRKSPV